MDIDEICTIWSMYVHTLRNKEIFFLKNNNLKKTDKIPYNRGFGTFN